MVVVKATFALSWSITQNISSVHVADHASLIGIPGFNNNLAQSLCLQPNQFW